MKVHLIFDFQFLYYKYKFALDSGRMKRLSAPVDVGGVRVEKDISQVYYALREMEGIRKRLEYGRNDVTVSICFDSKSNRKDQGTSESKAYKANRENKLNSDDFDNIDLVRQMLTEAGYNTYKLEGIEADDIIYNLVSKYKDSFDYTMIVTCDLDIGVNIQGSVGLYRFKSTSGYSAIDEAHFNEVVDAELKCHVPYNAIMLYKCTVGDKSDNIAGIKRFGPSAFNKLVDYLGSFDDIDWNGLRTKEKVAEILDKCGGYFTDEQMTQAKESLELVAPILISSADVPFPAKKSSRELREEAYMKLNMQSLVE